ncbi:MAG: hypothetical protein ABI779_02885 [Acidobacteriota bacterium]
MDRCEWGRDDYSLEIAALPGSTDVPRDIPTLPHKQASARKSTGTATLFSLDRNEGTGNGEES